MMQYYLEALPEYQVTHTTTTQSAATSPSKSDYKDQSASNGNSNPEEAHMTMGSKSNSAASDSSKKA